MHPPIARALMKRAVLEGHTARSADSWMHSSVLSSYQTPLTLCSNYRELIKQTFISVHSSLALLQSLLSVMKDEACNKLMVQYQLSSINNSEHLQWVMVSEWGQPVNIKILSVV